MASELSIVLSHRLPDLNVNAADLPPHDPALFAASKSQIDGIWVFAHNFNRKHGQLPAGAGSYQFAIFGGLCDSWVTVPVFADWDAAKAAAAVLAKTLGA